MFDTVRLYKRGVDGKDFQLNINKFKRTIDEVNDTVNYHNIFSFPGENNDEVKLYIDYDLHLRQGVNISFSVPKVANGTQLDNFRLSDKNRLYENLEYYLNDLIDIDYKNMKVSRLDITSNIYTDGEVRYYINALQSSYCKHRNYKVDYYVNESFTVYNKSRRFVIYDKIKEQIDKNRGKKKQNSKDINILRYEIQNKRGRDVKALLGKDLLFDDLFNEAVFLDAISVQRRYFRDLFLNKHIQQSIFETDRFLIELINKRWSRNLINKFLVKKQLDSDNFSFTELEALFSGVYTERGLRKALKELRELKFLTVNTTFSLLEEVYNKIGNLHCLVA